MLFNSYQFIFVFFPLAVLGFAVLGRVASIRTALSWVVLTSIIFYAWWQPQNLLIIAPSVLANYVLARVIGRTVDEKPRLALALLLLGVAGNVAFLSYFKYLGFLFEISNDFVGTNFTVETMALPLGISFITFQKIAFLIDVYTGRISSFKFRNYTLFVFFFPQLIAGPIVHYREMMPQFDKASGRVSAEDLAVGVGLFSFGLFKKVVLADGIAPYVSPLFSAASQGDPVTLLYAWLATIGFTLQVYFDFSGYSEMALGAARCFGIRLPVNFNSPLKATSIIDFWARWHVTLVRFLTAYVFNPMAFSLTRRRLARGASGLAGARTTVRAFIWILVLPTMVTMLLSGIWHGAGYGFLMWGLLHGAYLIVNHAWNLYRPHFWPEQFNYDRVMTPVGFVLTFVAVVAAMAFFRAPTIEGGFNIMRGMLGFNGVSLPRAIGVQFAPWLPSGISLDWSSGQSFVMSLSWLVVLLAIAWTLPNTLDVFRNFQPALDFKVSRDAGERLGAGLRVWRPSRAWAFAMAVLMVVGVLALGQPTEFLYWQF